MLVFPAATHSHGGRGVQARTHHRQPRHLIARLPQESEAEAFEQCRRKDWQDSEPHLLPAKHVAAWIQNNLYLALADAPFDIEDPALNQAAGVCKLTAHIDREVAARPELIQIENGWRNAPRSCATWRPRDLGGSSVRNMTH